MNIGVGKETFPGERRVALIPDSLPGLAKQGLAVLVEAGAGSGAAIPDSAFEEQGAQIAAERREVFKAAVAESAQAIVLVHNHPSGLPEPSSEDLVVTERLAEAGRILGIEILDHIVLGSQGFVSLKEMGHL